MHSITVWKLAKPPNYESNIDKIYPYSEVPYIGEYNLVKIPISLNNLLEHVDYWGEGKIVNEAGTSGFTNCYNVNHAYQLVSNGPDRDRKVPNRVPVLSYTNCNTSSYIKDNSVKIVTLMGAPINKSCANDVARIVNNDVGKVILYGFDKNSAYVQNIEEALTNKKLVYCFDYKLPISLQGLTLFDSHLAYLNLTDIGNELYNRVQDGAINIATEICKTLNETENGIVIADTVDKLLKSANKNVMPLAYKIWNSGSKEILNNYFPVPFKEIFNEENIKIVSKNHSMALKLDASTDNYGDRLAWGDFTDKSSNRVSWTLYPVWGNNQVYFKIKNTEHSMFLKMDVNTDSYGDRKVWGSYSSEELRCFWILEPMKINEKILFYIINREYNQGLKLDANPDSYGDRLLWGSASPVYGHPEYFGWLIQAWE